MPPTPASFGFRGAFRIDLPARAVYSEAAGIARILPHAVAVPLDAFDDPFFLTPAFSVWESRKHGWLEIVGPDIEHD